LLQRVAAKGPFDKYTVHQLVRSVIKVEHDLS
jgi:hypothetical protein